MFISIWRLSIALTLALASPLITRAQSVMPFPASVKMLSFSRGGSIYLSNLKTGTTKFIHKGYNPNLSPSGRFIAFTVSLKGPSEPDRTIKVLNLETNQIKDFKSLDGHISYGALWSPDEDQLALNILVDGAWHVGLLNVSGGELRLLTKGLQNKEWTFLSSWLPDGKSILCSDLISIYELGLDGAVRQKISVGELIYSSGISSSTKFSLSRDRRYLLFDSVTPDESYIYIYDLVKNSLSRVTPERIGGKDPQWLPGDKRILFTSFRKIGRRRFTFDVYTISTDGSNPVRLMRDVSEVSFSGQ